LHGSLFFNPTVLTYGPPSSTLTELLSILTQSDLSNIQVFHLGKNLILEVPMSPRLPHIFWYFLGFFCNIINSCWDFIFQAVGILSSKLLGFCLPTCWVTPNWRGIILCNNSQNCFGSSNSVYTNTRQVGGVFVPPNFVILPRILLGTGFWYLLLDFKIY